MGIRATDDDALMPVATLLKLPQRTVTRRCRNEDIPGAIKVGRTWMITRSAWRAFIGEKPSPASTAEADLLRAGFRYAR